jgi:hypothetical protein
MQQGCGVGQICKPIAFAVEQSSQFHL